MDVASDSSQGVTANVFGSVNAKPAASTAAQKPTFGGGQSIAVNDPVPGGPVSMVTGLDQRLPL